MDDHTIPGPTTPPESVDDPLASLPDGSETRELTPEEQRELRRRRRRNTAIAIPVGLVILILGVAAVWQVPYYRFAPGTLYPTQDSITVTGAPTFNEPGRIDFTTVSSKKVSALEAAWSKLDPANELVPAELVDGTNTPDQTRTLNLEMMDDSKRNAEVVALRQLGYPVQILGTGAVVRKVAEGLPAQAFLHENDTITAIDGTKVTTADEAIKALSTHKPGDSVAFTFDPAPDVDHPEDAPPARTVTAVLAPRKEDPNRPILGVDLGTRNTQFKLPFNIDIDSKSVGGPSAGLAFTLGIIDVLTPGSLTGGNNVAVTGTMNPDGSVGPIGGIQQKTFLARRNGITLFIVPKSEAADATRFAEGEMRVVGVDNIDDALKALHDNGGSTDVVEQTAAAHGGGTTAH